MKNNSKVSVIIPVYNEENNINECLASVCGQTFHDIEIICIDDKSTDNSLTILEQYANRDERIRIIRMPENVRQGGARNAGLEIARGEYIWFIDADDKIDLDAVEVLVNKMEELSDVDVLTFDADAFYINEDGDQVDFPDRKIERKWPKNTKLYLPRDAEMIPSLIAGSSVTFFSRRSFIESYRYRPGVFFEDACFTFSVLTADGVFFQMDYCPYHRRVSDKSTTGMGDSYPPAQLKDRIIAMQDIAAVIKQRNFDENYFGVVWFKKYARFFINKYVEQDISDPPYDAMIEKLDKEWQLYRKSPLILKRNAPVVIVMGVNSSRLPLVDKMADVFLSQYFVPDKVVFWLNEKDFPGEEVPSELQKFGSSRLEIIRCENVEINTILRSSLKKYPDSVIITVGEENDFSEKWLSDLYRAYLADPCVHCSRAKKIEISINGVYFVRKGVRVNGGLPRYLNKPEQSGYVLYPPHCFHSDIHDTEKILRFTPSSPDLWCWLMAVLNSYKTKADMVDDSLSSGDYLNNEENWTELDAVLKEYPLLAWRLRDENRSEIETRESIKQLAAVQKEHAGTLKQLESTQKKLDTVQNKLESTQKKLDTTQNKLESTQKSLETSRAELKASQNQLTETKKRLREAESEIVRSEREIQNIMATWSYRSGRLLTYIPRKLKALMNQQKKETDE